MNSSAPASSNQASVGRFFLLTFAITWTLQLPGVLAQEGLLPGGVESYMPLVILGVFGPLIAATWFTARDSGRTGVVTLYRRLLIWRVHWGWYVAALILPGALLSGVLALLNLAGRNAEIAYIPGASGVLAALLISVAEEVGWRGYALPRLEPRYGAFGASGIIGVAWTFWHIPMFLGLGVPMNLMLVMLLFFVGGSLMFTWIVNGTRGSLLLAVLAHTGAHLNNSHSALPADTLPAVVHAIAYAGIGWAVLRPKTALWFTRTNGHHGRPDF